MTNQSSGDERRTIDELAMRYELEPTLRDIYVEGAFDVSVVGEVLKQAGCHSAAVYEINVVDIPPELLGKHNLPDGNKGRVIALCFELDLQVANPALVSGLVDRDYDRIVGRDYANRLLMFTDYSCMEMYFFDELVIERFCRIFLRRNGDLAIQLIRELTPILRDLFFIRATNEYLQLGLHWLEADKQCVFQNEVLELDRKTFVQKYLNKTAMLHELSRFNETLESFQTASDEREVRHQINGHDFVRLLAKRLHPIVRNKNIADADVIERVLPGFADYGQLSEAQMFATLISRVSS
jgi:hypothetical protein